MRHDFADGKYTVINNDGTLTALRHGEPWARDLVGDNLVYWMLIEVDRLKALSVANIMLEVVPGPDGMGQEVFAESVSHVVAKLTELGQAVEDAAGAAVPTIDMVLHCPSCGLQHIDAPEDSEGREHPDNRTVEAWTNPPHRSHLCAQCGHVWRPADVCTNGVQAITTRGKNDDPVVQPTPPAAWGVR